MTERRRNRRPRLGTTARRVVNLMRNSQTIPAGGGSARPFTMFVAAGGDR